MRPVINLEQRIKEDVEGIVGVASSNTTEFFSRQVILLSVAGIGSLVTGNFWYFLWAVTYVVLSWIGRVCQIRLTRRANPAAYFSTLAAFTTRTVIFRGLVIYLWFYPEHTHQILALSMMVAATLYAVSQLPRVPTFLGICMVADLCVFSIIAVSGLLASSGDPEQLIVFGALFGVVVYNLICIRNSRQIQASLRAAERRSLQSQKLESLGQLTGGVAHDFNNILTVIIGNLELYQMLDDEAEKDKLARDAAQAAARAAALVAQLLAFSRKSQLIETDIIVSELFADVGKLATRTLPPSIQITFETTDNACIVFADVGQLQSALLNLIINARDAMNGAGNITLSAHGHLVEAHAIENIPPGQYIQIDVADDGPGIPLETLEQVFEPFFTTKAIGEGSGLGLSMVKGFTEQSGGAVTLRSTPAAGTTVSLLLPCVTTRADSSAPT